MSLIYQIKKVQYVVQTWNCIGIDEKGCNNKLTNINSRKPKRRCETCQHEYKKKMQRINYYKRMGINPT